MDVPGNPEVERVLIAVPDVGRVGPGVGAAHVGGADVQRAVGPKDAVALHHEVNGVADVLEDVLGFDHGHAGVRPGPRDGHVEIEREVDAGQLRLVDVHVPIQDPGPGSQVELHRFAREGGLRG
jgi:hypothetical protein